MNDQSGDVQAARIRIASTDEIAAALDSAGLRLDRAVIVLVGGAGIMGEKEFETITRCCGTRSCPSPSAGTPW